MLGTCASFSPLMRSSLHPMQNEAPVALPILDSIIRCTDVDDANIVFTMQEFVS
jgi:hypothetical protein